MNVVSAFLDSWKPNSLAQRQMFAQVTTKKKKNKRVKMDQRAK